MTRKIVALFVASLIAGQLACRADGPGRSGYDADEASASSPRSEAAPRAATAQDGAATAVADDTLARDDTGAARSIDSQAPGVILFLGTSLTAGYGVGEAAAFPALIARRIEEAGLPYRVVNAGLSGETSAGGLRRLEWSLQEPVDVLVLELGANDGLRGQPVERMRANLKEILERTRDAYPDVRLVIAGMEAPPNLGQAYTRNFRDTFRDLAREYDAALIPFVLEGVAGEPDLNLDDRIHPNHAGHRVIADNVWAVLEPVLRAP